MAHSVAEDAIIKTLSVMTKADIHISQVEVDVVQAVIRALDITSDKLEDRIFLVATGQKLITPGELEIVVKDLIPRADIEVGPGLTDWNKREIKYRGMININRARQQLGYEPKYDIRAGIREFIDLYRKYITEEEGAS